MTAVDVLDLHRQYVETREPRIREALVRAHAGLARSVALGFMNRGEPYDDLFQVAQMGLLKAIERFDPDKGYQFSTYANATMSGELKRYFRDRAWALRTPRAVQELYLKVKDAADHLAQQLARSPSVAEVAAYTSATEDAVIEAMEAGTNLRTLSLDATPDDDPGLQLQVGTDESGFGLIEEHSLLAPLLARLPARERRILELRFGRGMTQSEVAAEVGLSQMHVSRLLARTLDQLRTWAAQAETTA
jgi:RNA polymerase sigma-B factor